MKVIDNIYDIKKELSKFTDIGFVPTMGALHNGHISLIKEARKNNKIVVVSIFVNPTQFLEGEDFDKYPKQIEQDIKICENEKVDFLFIPAIEQMYNDDELSIIAPQNKGFILEGFHRPGHFNGVLQVVLKLFNIIKPKQAYFGKKDAQQLYLIKKMVKDLFLDIDIVGCDLIRDDDGLALSSRNVYLSQTDKIKALSISKSLFLAKKLINNNENNINNIKSKMLEILDVDKIEYIEFVNKDFDKISEIKKNDTIILIAVYINGVRLIDNIWI